jgi:surface antigen
MYIFRLSTESESRVYLEANELIHKFRFHFAGVFIIACLLSLSALVTNIGANSVLNSKTHAYTRQENPDIANNPYVMSANALTLVDDVKAAAISTGRAVYGTCSNITGFSAKGGAAIVHGGTAMTLGVWHGAVFIGHNLANANLFLFRLPVTTASFVIDMPAKVLASVTTPQKVSAILRPAADKPVPVIDAETSASVLATLSAQQRQEIEKLQAQQVAANRNLGGSIYTGDAAHGGYPAKWDNAWQDSQIDSWGMYNRECVSYAAWKVYQTYGSMPYWGGVGNANQWVRNARNAGITTSAVPQAHTVAISMRGYYGHAMWVEKVQGDMIYVSQYNYDLNGHYSEMWISSANLTYIYFH